MNARAAEIRFEALTASFARARCAVLAAVLVLLTLTTGCQQKMADQPSYKPLDASTFFADGRSARPIPAGTVARGHLHLNRALYTGRYSGERRAPDRPQPPNEATEPAAAEVVARETEQNSDFVAEFPLSIDRRFVEHGRQRYMIYCVVCHDPLGTGRGKIVERGFTRPPSYHVGRLRQAPVGRLFAVMSEGYGSMPAYAAQVPVRDRWAIAAYVRALQLSQHFPAEDLPAEERRRWTEESVDSAPEPAAGGAP